MSNKMALDALTAALDAMEHMANVLNNIDAVDEDEDAQHDAAFEAVRAAIAALQAEPQGWGPIETAPKDGSTYLVADAVRGMVAPHIRGVIHNNRGTAHDWQYGEAATHWMPLPTPPKD